MISACANKQHVFVNIDICRGTDENLLKVFLVFRMTQPGAEWKLFYRQNDAFQFARGKSQVNSQNLETGCPKLAVVKCLHFC